MQEPKLTHLILCLYKKSMSFHDVIKPIKSDFNKHKNYNYYYNVFLEKGSYELPKSNNNKQTLYELQMLYYDRTDFSKRIGINKTSASKERDILHYFYFFG